MHCFGNEAAWKNGSGQDDACFRQAVKESVVFLKSRLASPEIVIALGTGLAGLAERLSDSQTIPYDQIPHFPEATAPEHPGNLISGILGGRRVVLLQGRFHYYEGYSCRQLTLPLRVLSLLGCHSFIVSNAAGGLDPAMRSGDFMLLSDHLNFIPDNPLRGANVESWGPRFPDMSVVYDRQLLKGALAVAAGLGLENVRSGVYVAVAGPSLETPAETRFLRNCGADAVGMSTVPEVIVARHAGLRVLGISVIANVNDPDNFKAILLEDVVRAMHQASDTLAAFMAAVIEQCL